MGRPGGGVMVRNTRLKGLPGSYNGLLRFAFGFKRQRLARILAVAYPWRACRGGLRAQSDLVVNKHPPASRALYPDAQHVNFSPARHNRAHLAIGALLDSGSAFIAESRLGHGLENLRPGLRFSFRIRPGKIRISECGECRLVVSNCGLDECTVRL